MIQSIIETHIVDMYVRNYVKSHMKTDRNNTEQRSFAKAVVSFRYLVYSAVFDDIRGDSLPCQRLFEFNGLRDGVVCAFVNPIHEIRVGQ